MWVNGDGIGLLLEFLNIRQAERVAQLGGEGADRVTAAFVRAEGVTYFRLAMRPQAEYALDRAAGRQGNRQAFIYQQPGNGQPAVVLDHQPDRNILAPEDMLFEFALAGDVFSRLARPDQADDINPQEQVNDREGKPALHEGGGNQQQDK